ncbi:MAG: hypothetical protein V1754_02370, partial [Pseudomonadota bacterium]
KELLEKVVAGELSPIGFFAEYQNFNLRDLAKRVGVSKNKLMKHMTPQGFDAIDVKTLKKYAKNFDVALCDFFQFIYVPGEIEVSVKTSSDRVIQQVTIATDS